MIDFTLAELAPKLSAYHYGADVKFRRISIDTRKLQPGDVFIALSGPNYDGHHFIADAQAKGAVAAIVSQTVASSLPLLHVADTRLALAALARLRRKAVDIPFVAVTGSCGKTTTKTMIAAILAQCGNTLATQGTLNNDLGVPLTLLAVTEQHDYAVIELGANNPGEIAYIAAITQPNIALITNAAPVHLEGFKTLAGVAQAKGEIYQALAADGIAIINADDDFAGYWLEHTKSHSVITFGIHRSATVFANQIQLNQQQQPCFQLNTPAGDIMIALQLFGEHNIANALAAAAVGFAMGIPLPAIKAGLESVQPVDKRLVQKRGLNGALLIDDSYNANPHAFKIAIQTLVQTSGQQKVLIMGDMAELGGDAVHYHAEVGRIAREQGIEQLYTVGELSQYAARAFGQDGYHYPSKQALIDAIKPRLMANMTILIKGSRSAGMEQVVAGLMANDQEYTA